jgi:chromosome partitioning protein
LLIDFDPQANASSSLGFKPSLETKGVYHGLFNLADVESLIRPTTLYNYHFIPSSQHLAGALVELINVQGREFQLKKFVDKIRDRYDYVLVDLPPSLSLLTINGLVAADEVVIPAQAQHLSFEGLAQMLEVVDLIKNNLSTDLKIAGAVITMHHDSQVAEDLIKKFAENFKHNIFQTRIPWSMPLAEAPSFGRPVVLYNQVSDGARAYENLAQEIINQEPN